MTSAAVEMMIPSSGLCEIAPGWQPGELAHDDLQIAFNGGEVGPCLISLAQCKRVFL
jgi:hypothetical protein